MNEKYTEVLSQYELEILDVKRGRGAWLCETDQGLKLLREYKGTIKRLEFEDQVFLQLEETGHLSVDRYVRNKEGEILSSAEDGTRWIVKNWYSDRECNLKDSKEVLCAIERIALLHKMFRNVKFKEEWNLGSILVQQPAEEMERHNRELIRARSFIRSKEKSPNLNYVSWEIMTYFLIRLWKPVKDLQAFVRNAGLGRGICVMGI